MAVENLRCVLWRNNIYQSEAVVRCDPDDTATLIAHLKAQVRRAGWGDHHLPEFVLEVHEEIGRGKRRVTVP